MIANYWHKKGKYQEKGERLSDLVPCMGGVEGNEPLELFRIASNVYYDIYNNGEFNGFLFRELLLALDGGKEQLPCFNEEEHKRFLEWLLLVSTDSYLWDFWHNKSKDARRLLERFMDYVIEGVVE